MTQQRILELALVGALTERARIDHETSDVRARLGGAARVPESARLSAKRALEFSRRGAITPAGRKKLSELMKRRWAVKKRARRI